MLGFRALFFGGGSVRVFPGRTWGGGLRVQLSGFRLQIFGFGAGFEFEMGSLLPVLMS